MAIDRGPWNALVDDDGSNLVGTVWNKDKIKTVILDPVDQIGTWITQPFNAAHYQGGGAGMTWTVAAGNVATNRYTVIGKTLIWTFWIDAAPVGGTMVSSVVMTLPGGFTVAAQGAHSVPWAANNSTILGVYAYWGFGALGPTITIASLGAPAWTTGTLAVRGTITVPIL